MSKERSPRNRIWMDKKKKLLILTIAVNDNVIDIVDDINLLWQYAFRGILNWNQKRIAEDTFHYLFMRRR